jgi:hypothetical protein
MEDFLLEKYDEDLRTIPHYKNHPQMLPFIGKNWEKGVEKALLVGESSLTVYAFDWYERSSKQLNHNQREDTSVREIIENGLRKDSFGVNRIFTEINSIIKNEYNGKKDLSYFSFMNFFQRPATKKNKVFDKRDISIGNKTIKEVLEILKPDYIFILSRLAWERLNIDYDSKILVKLFDEKKIEFSCHPTCSWWNRVTKPYSGIAKDKFIRFLLENKLLNI